MKTRLEKRGRQVYILSAFIRWAAFRFLAITTALFSHSATAPDENAFSEKVARLFRITVIIAFLLVVGLGLGWVSRHVPSAVRVIRRNLS